MSTKLDKARVLIVEDEIMLAMNLQDMLTDLGYQVVGIATRMEKALALATDGAIDFAIVDINLAGTLSFPVADILRQRAIPFLFASGYGTQGLIENYAGEYVLTKPFGARELERAIELVMPKSGVTASSMP